MRFSKRLAQNIIEFTFVFPILVIFALVLFELGFFWQNVNSVYNLNNEINANISDVNYGPSKIQMGTTCPAATEALSLIKTRGPVVMGMNSDFMMTKLLDTNTTEPFALYKYTSSETAKNGQPIMTLWVDCRNLFEDGISTQIEFFHKVVVLHASIPRFDGGEAIDVIPENILIASPKTVSIRQY